MLHSSRSRPGWRLVELVIVLGIVAVLLGIVAVFVDHVKDRAERVSCNLGSIVVAVHCYHDEHGHLPPAAHTAEDGTPLLSWRVLILPYLEESNLFAEFRLDEPWDSPHNLALVPRMPRTYAAPGRKASRLPPHHTMLNVFVGEGTPFEVGKKLKLATDFPRGTEETLLFVEAGEAVPWTKPNALPYSPHAPLPPLNRLFRDEFRACAIGSCSYRYIRKDTPEAELRALITR